VKMITNGKGSESSRVRMDNLRTITNFCIQGTQWSRRNGNRVSPGYNRDCSYRAMDSAIRLLCGFYLRFLGCIRKENENRPKSWNAYILTFCIPFLPCRNCFYNWRS
jgi:hypothetical protein